MRDWLGVRHSFLRFTFHVSLLVEKLAAAQNKRDYAAWFPQKRALEALCRMRVILDLRCRTDHQARAMRNALGMLDLADS